MQFEYLADFPEFMTLLARLHHAEWGALMPEWSLALAEVELASHVNRCAVPTTILAMDDGKLLGSASLLVDDLPGWEHLSPWIGSVFVMPAARGKGVGKALVQRAMADAGLLGASAIYLFTAGQVEFYARLGWTRHAQISHAGHAMEIMRYPVPSDCSGK